MLDYEGCSYLRQRLVLCLLSGKSVKIRNIRASQQTPGLREFELTLIKVLDSITNGSRVNINKSGTELVYLPGVLEGGELCMECGVDKCISYYLYVLMILGPFCKHPIRAKLKGVTHIYNDISVEHMRVAWLPVMRHFLPNDEALLIKVTKRGLAPQGGGEVTFSCPIVRQLKPVLRENYGKIKKIRGTAFACKVSPLMMTRMIDSAKEAMKGYITDVFITADHCKGAAGGNSPGYGVTLHAETTEGVIYCGEAMSQPRGGEVSTPEQVGIEAVHNLLNDIYLGGCITSTAHELMCLNMALCQSHVSKCVLSPLSMQSVWMLRHLEDMLSLRFKVDKIAEDEEQLLVTCVGVGVSNIAKNIM